MNITRILALQRSPPFRAHRKIVGKAKPRSSASSLFQLVLVFGGDLLREVNARHHIISITSINLKW